MNNGEALLEQILNTYPRHDVYRCQIVEGIVKVNGVMEAISLLRRMN